MSDINLIEKGIDPRRLPAHVAIIMDGNGRWASKRFMPRISGHRAGVKTVDRIVTIARKIGISAVTLYSFSSENWNRPAKEIEGLMKILQEYLRKELERMLRQGIRFNTIGDVEILPDFAQEIIREVKESTKHNKDMVLTLALSYGSRKEIVDAVKEIGKRIKKGEILPEEIDESYFESFLHTNNLPPPDLLIRTSGEVRISNFLLWQIAYSELYFTDILWPDFKEDNFLNAIKIFQNRERRFGKTAEQLANINGLKAAPVC